MLSVASLCLLCPTSVAQEAPAVPYQLEVREFFRSDGAEPSYWASYSRSDFARVPDPAGLTTFSFELREIATVLGKEPETQFMVESGTNKLVISHDRETQLLGLGGSSAIVDFVNQNAARIQEWEGGFRQSMVPFDGTVVPGLSGGEVVLSCSTEPLSVDGRRCALVRYSATDHPFKIDDAQVVMSYRGIAIIDPESGVVYHSLFEQQGEVVNGDKISRVQHRIAVTLLDMALGGEIALLLPPRVVDQVNSYLFAPREDLDPLNPSLDTNEIIPSWSVDLWVAGRLAEMNMGVVAERGTNPLPVTALGSLVLTDQAISFGGTQLVQQRRLELGADEASVALVERVESPLERAYGTAPFSERLNLVGPETTGVRRVEGRDAAAVGLLLLLTLDVFDKDKIGPRLSFATSNSAALAASGGTPAWALITAGGGAGAVLSGGALLPGLLGVGVVALAVDAARSEGTRTIVPGAGGTGYSAGLTLNETFSQGCSSGEFLFQIVDNQGGRTWAAQGNGSISATAGCNASGTTWMDAAQATSVAGQSFMLRLEVPPHSCVDGTVTLTVNGAPATFAAFGSNYVGQLSSPCF